MHLLSRLAILGAVVGLTGSAAFAQTIQFNLLSDIDMSGNTAATTLPSAVGNNISAVAWDGTNLYVGGYNQSGTSVGIVQVANALTAPVLGTTFGSDTIATSRGYTQLAIQNGVLAAGTDNGGSTNNNAVAAYTAATGATLWTNGAPLTGTTNNAIRGGNGVGFDPDPTAGVGATVASVAYGSGRRLAFSLANGSAVYSQSGGPVGNGADIRATSGVANGASAWRDIAFDPTTGTEYARNENTIVKVVRSSDNTVSAATTLIGSTAGNSPFGVLATIDNQGIAFVGSSAYGNFLIANDRPSNATGQSAASVLRAVDPVSGNLLTLNFNNTLPNSVGAYSFSFDSGTQTLALSDFGNNQVYIYKVGPITSGAAPEPGAILLALSGGGVLLGTRRRRPDRRR